MDKKIQKEILLLLKKSARSMDEDLIFRNIQNKNLFGSVVIKSSDKSKIRHELKLLEEKGLIKLKFSDFLYFAELSLKGYQEFDSWYLKLWRWFNNDFAKLLSTIAIILSIIATIISIWNK